MEVEARWVRHHHERFDGGGYPDGLAGEEIPLESRVILVADAFEAMTSDRPYRQAPGQSFAIVELGRQRRHAVRSGRRRGPHPRARPRRRGRAHARSGDRGGLTVSAAGAERSPVSAAGMTRGAGRTGRSFSSSSRSEASHGVVEGAALRAVLLEVAEDEVGNAGFAHWYGMYTHELLRNPDSQQFWRKVRRTWSEVEHPSRRARGIGMAAAAAARRAATVTAGVLG